MLDWADLETPLNEAPLFPCEQPDGRKHIAETPRVVTFRQMVRIAAPAVLLFANANAGKRNPNQARREGIKAGVFDQTAAWYERQIAFLEFKGYDARGRAGRLSDPQVLWGNMMHRRGFPVACFFTPDAAVEWLRSLGAPMLGVSYAA